MNDLLPVTKNIALYDGMGFVELVDMMPRLVPQGRTADLAVSRNARVSYAGADKSAAEDDALVRYLTEHWHSSPSESVVFQFRIRCPIFVERQLVRHRTARLNEQSHRYTVPREQFYYPPLRMQLGKQTSQVAALPDGAQECWQQCSDLTKQLYKHYLTLVESGVAREVARTCLPVSLMTELMWQMDLNNLMNFLRLRQADTAQHEIRELANAIHQLVAPLVPVSMKAYSDFRVNALVFTSEEIAHLQQNGALSERKRTALTEKLRALDRSSPEQ